MERPPNPKRPRGGTAVILTLRNIAVRLWLSAITGIPLTFWLYPDVLELMPTRPPGPLPFTLAILVSIFFILGTMMNFVGHLIISRQISEAERWERAGIFSKSETYYLKVIGIVDSPLISLLQVGAITRKVTGAIARFHLTTHGVTPHMDSAVLTFLHHRPDQTALARLWIERRFSQHPLSPLTPREDRLITRLAEQATDTDHKFLTTLAGLLIKTNRNDFVAQRVFELVLSNKNECLAGETPLQNEIKEFIFQHQNGHGRRSEKIKHEPPVDGLGKNVQREVNNGHIKPPDTTKHDSLRSTKGKDAQINAHVSAATTRNESSDMSLADNSFQINSYGSRPTKSNESSDMPLADNSFQIKSKQAAPERKSPSEAAWPDHPTLADEMPQHHTSLRRSKPLMGHPIQLIQQFMAFIIWGTLRLLQNIKNVATQLFNSLLTNGTPKTMVKWGTALILIGGLSLLIANTVSYLFPPTPTPLPPAPPTAEVMEPVLPVNPTPPLLPKRFTIQVSAYLKESHAQAFLEQLTDQGITSWISTAEGGGKTWYLIRIEKFATKADAALFGDTLKGKKMINDYFVDNLKPNER